MIETEPRQTLHGAPILLVEPREFQPELTLG
jgi:hypothetical protein